MLVSGAIPSFLISLRANICILVVTSVAVDGLISKRYAPVTEGLSSNAYSTICVSSGFGLTNQNSLNTGNSSPELSAVSIARPRAEIPYT